MSPPWPDRLGQARLAVRVRKGRESRLDYWVGLDLWVSWAREEEKKGVEIVGQLLGFGPS